MKKLIITILICSFSFAGFSQSSSIGITAGLHSLRLSEDGFSANSEGFYIGLFSDISINETLDFHPELHYANIEDTSLLIAPLLLKYKITDKFNLQGGPQIDYFLEDTGNEFDSFGLSLALGAGYNITEKFIIQARYGIGITNRWNGELKVGSFQAGIGYRFN